MPAFMVPEGCLDGSSTGRLEPHKGQDAGHCKARRAPGGVTVVGRVARDGAAVRDVAEVKLLREAQRRRQQIVERRAALEMDASAEAES